MEAILKVGYYPGCSQTGTAKEYDTSLRKVIEKLGASFDEVKDWSCCGATSAHVTNHKLANALAMRNVMLAEQQGLDDMVAPCAACYNRLVSSQFEMKKHPELKQEVESILETKFQKDVKVMNLIELFLKVGTEKISENRKLELKNLKVACYYGWFVLQRLQSLTMPNNPLQWKNWLNLRVRKQLTGILKLNAAVPPIPS
jgi:heterodisulfide reductase subunit B